VRRTGEVRGEERDVAGAGSEDGGGGGAAAAGAPAGPPFGALLRRARRAAGLTQEELAERAGLSVRAVSDLERGVKRGPRAASLRLLVDALGLAPDARAALAAAAARPAAAPAPPPHNLPLQLTSFVGRERELAAVRRLLAGARLLTLTGAGGAGKTRLALEAAAGVAGAYAAGTWLVALAPVGDPALVGPAIAGALGVREAGARPLRDALADHLRERCLLLVLDNFEHLLAAAPLVPDLLAACPGLTVLATSRAPLRVSGEQEYPVPPLALPDAAETAPASLTENEAVRLFVERARAVRPDFVVTDQNARAVAEVCRRLDGLPLALELAAARVRVLGVEELLARLEDRFRLLTGGSRTALERHQTLQAAVDWSYDLLTDQERALFARLAVFAGGWTLEAAEAVGAGEGVETSEVLDLLTRLVDQSLVQAEAQPDGTVRYRLLETLRAYARDTLAAGGLEARVRDRHAGYYAALAERAAPELRGPDSAAWHDRVERELDNVRGALGWAAAGGPVAAGLRLATALHWYWFMRRPLEGRAWLDRILALPGPSEPACPAAAVGLALRARALGGAALLALGEGDLEVAQAQGGEALALARQAGDRPATATALGGLGGIARARGEDTVARSLWEESLALSGELGDRLGMAISLRHLARIAARGRDDALAEAHYQRALALHREAGDHSGTAGVLGELGNLARGRADFAGAREAYEASLAHFREAGDPQGCALSLGRLAGLAAARGEHAAARAAYAASLRGFHAVGRRWAVALTLVGLAAVAGAEGRWARALRLAAAATAAGAGPPRPLIDALEWGLLSMFISYCQGPVHQTLPAACSREFATRGRSTAGAAAGRASGARAPFVSFLAFPPFCSFRSASFRGGRGRAGAPAGPAPPGRWAAR
jgi:non-specific serine/threonine protein kinase